LREANKQKQREHRERVLLAYMQAVWQRIDADKLPNLDDLLGDDPDAVDPEAIKAREQSPTEMGDILKTFAARSKRAKSRVEKRRG
jgi:hypothetical protein